MKILGHGQISITMDVYTHVVHNPQREAISHMGRLLKPVGPPPDRLWASHRIVWGGMLIGLVLLLVLAISWCVLGVHALLLGRMPGRRLSRLVRQPRLWGTGALLMVLSWNVNSPSLLAVGLGFVALGHLMKPER